MLLTVEGIDGSGKSATCRVLADAYPDAVMTREPTDSWYGEAVERSIEREDADPLAELFLYTADHAAHLANTIEPALEHGRHVISDRYVDSRYAYQGATLDDRFSDAVGFVKDIHEPWTRRPDLTVYIDVPAEVGVRRSGGSTKFEHTKYLEIVRDNYEQLIEAEPDRFVRIDGTRSQQAVMEEVRSIVDVAITD